MFGYVKGGSQQGVDSSRAPYGCVYYFNDNCDDFHILLGYYNPLLAYGEEKAIHDAREAGASGFIMVDLPPEEAIIFRDKCAKAGYVFPSSTLCRRF